MGLAIPGSLLALGQHVPLTIAHAKGVTLCENFQRNAMKSGGEYEFAAAVFPTGSDTGGSGCDAWLRQVTPTVGAANSGKERATSIPDFSGVWTHSIPGFEPLASGPTALVNRSRRTPPVAGSGRS